MGEQTAIRWSRRTFNPWWGCEKIAAPDGERSACDHCYAATLAERFGWSDGGAHGTTLWGKGTPRRELSEKNWALPVKWNREAEALGITDLVFCASMADVFEGRADLDPLRARLWELIEATPNLIWQVLTKRPENVMRMVPERWLGPRADGMVQIDPTHLVPYTYLSEPERAKVGWPKNVWLGTTVESQRTARIRVPRLLDVPGVPVYWLSVEPLFTDINLIPYLHESTCWYNEMAAHPDVACTCYEPVERTVNWVIVGGESGAGYQPMELDHARSIRDQVATSSAGLFFKQVGGLTPAAGGHELDGELLEGWPPGFTPPPPVAERPTPVKIGKR